MDLKNIIFIIIFFPIAFQLASCTKDQVQAENSLEGIWEVTLIRSNYGMFSETVFNATESIEESGELGTFNFMEDVVQYSFTRNDTLFNETSSWRIDLEKVNSGFTRVNEFTLDIEDQFLFDVRFEDETSNAEKDAKNVSLTQIPQDNSGILIEIILEKR